MCLAIPGKLISIKDSSNPIFKTGKVSFDGVIKQVNLSLVPEAEINDYVVVHVGAAISTIDEKEARKTFEALKQMGELDELDANT